MLQPYIEKIMEAALGQQIVITILGTLIGTGLGATAAFRLERSWRREDARLKEIQRGQDVLAGLFAMQMSEEDVWTQNFASEQGDETAELLAPPTSQIAPVTIDVMSLNFLLSTEHAPLLRDLRRETDRHKYWIDVLNNRSRAREEMQKAFDVWQRGGSGRKDHDLVSNNFDLTQLQEIVGRQVIATVKDFNRYLFDYRKENRTSASALFRDLLKALQARYPGEFKYWNTVKTPCEALAASAAVSQREG